MEERTTDIQGQERQETQPARAGEWKVDVEEIMDGVHDEEAGAPDTAVTTQPVDGEDGEGYTLKHLDEVRTVSRDKVIELAQKGLDYDRVRAKLESARDRLAEYERWLGEVSGGKRPEEFRDELSARALAEREGIELDAALERVRSGRSAQTGAERPDGARAKREVREFFAAHPEAAAKLVSDRGAIPDEVWRRVRAGESLSAAWESVKLREGAKAQGERVRTLERELAETRQAKRNSARSTGSAASDGGEVERDLAALGWNEV